MCACVLVFVYEAWYDPTLWVLLLVCRACLYALFSFFFYRFCSKTNMLFHLILTSPSAVGQRRWGRWGRLRGEKQGRSQDEDELTEKRRSGAVKSSRKVVGCKKDARDKSNGRKRRRWKFLTQSKGQWKESVSYDDPTEKARSLRGSRQTLDRRRNERHLASQSFIKLNIRLLKIIGRVKSVIIL